MVVTELSPEERQVWVDAAKPVIEKYKEVIGEDLVNQLVEEAKQ